MAADHPWLALAIVGLCVALPLLLGWALLSTCGDADSHDGHDADPHDGIGA